MGTICLSLRFDNKLKSKNLEVDFLVVDVLTAYNVILGCPTLHNSTTSNQKKKKQKHTRKKKGLHITLSTILIPLLLRSLGLSIQGVGCLIPCTLSLAGRRDKLYPLRVTTFILGPLTLVHIAKQGPVGSLIPWPGLPFLLPRPHQPQPSQAPPLASAGSPSFRLLGHPDQPLAFPNEAGTDPSNLRHSAAVLTPRANTSAVATSSSVTIGGSEVPGVAKSQDLTKSWRSENLATESALMKLVEGCWVLTGELPAA
ncbi:LOW QUALITY PROTEIN: hypothetical protein Cgig2_019236 [Carnegiea gigantea]|uniref:Uncharacterized protein n=1 Tax=Carnegiea gigantea TaxID=171969 RepID=A0A9Q1JWH7_9CARY|nr:LOW QUALITY PROTEIN: hypothetical protein Cgig2_019236 [Carnegiea gigantea]